VLVESTEFLLAALVVVLFPGTGVPYTIATAITRGWTASAAAAFGCTLGIVPTEFAAFSARLALSDQ
jgi:threonine/homoserine/homoserine lactone efflux protein